MELRPLLVSVVTKSFHRHVINNIIDWHDGKSFIARSQSDEREREREREKEREREREERAVVNDVMN